MTMTVIYIVAGLVALAIIGLFLLVLIPNRALPDPRQTEIGDITSRGLLRNIALQI